MTDPAGSSQLSTGDATSVAWLISFGDLLTLLVCFFLVLTPWSTHSKENKKAQNQGVASHNHKADQSGIPFASRPRGLSSDLIADIPIVKSKLVAAPQGLRAEIVSRIGSVAAENAGKATRIIVRLCDPKARAQALNMLKSMEMEWFRAGHSVQVELAHECEERTDLDLGLDEVVGRILIVDE